MANSMKRTGSRAGSAKATFVLVAGASLALVIAACTGAVDGTKSSSKVVDTVPGSGGAGGSSGAGGAGDGLPCDVAALLSDRCIGCHSDPPVGGATTALLTYADLTATSKLDPPMTVAEVALMRIQSTASPMPPVPNAPPTAAEVASFAAWVNGGAPKGDCTPDAGSNPFDAAAQCTSGKILPAQQDGSAFMFPGYACVDCHKKNNGPALTIGGTVYATPHEPDDCEAKTVMGPAIIDAVVEITDHNGKVIELAVNSYGNFYRRTSQGAVAMPYTAKVKYNGNERAMLTAQTTGDCNSCHTQDGSMTAPGRILLP